VTDEALTCVTSRQFVPQRLVTQGAEPGSLYNVAGPEPIPFGELLQTCTRAVGSRTRLGLPG
jgi:hypothetical protein